jgi:anthranilate synthase component II
MLVMIDNYDSFTFNIVQYFRELKQEIIVFRNNQISSEEIFNLPLKALIISPGPCTPSKAGISNKAILTAVEKSVPVLGVCLGYQCIGEIFGGKISHAPYLMHGKLSDIHHTNVGVFSNIPSPFKAVRYHSLALEPETVPECLQITARTEDNVIMAVQHKTLPIHGVQFHPESVLSEHGHQLLQNFLDLI